MACRVFLQDHQGVIGPLAFAVEFNVTCQTVVLHLRRWTQGSSHVITWAAQTFVYCLIRSVQNGFYYFLFLCVLFPRGCVRMKWYFPTFCLVYWPFAYQNQKTCCSSKRKLLNCLYDITQDPSFTSCSCVPLGLMLSFWLSWSWAFLSLQTLNTFCSAPVLFLYLWVSGLW